MIAAFWSRGVYRTTAHGLLCALFVTNAAPVRAQDRVLWRCDTPSGHFDQKFFPIPGTTATVSGKLIVNKADIGPKWNSIAKITVAQGGGGDCHCSGLSLAAFNKPVTVNYYATANGADLSMAESDYGKPISFSISFGPDNVMTVRIGKTDPATKSVRLLHPEHDFVVMSCSGTDVSFLDVAVQYDFHGKTVTHSFEPQDQFPG